MKTAYLLVCTLLFLTISCTKPHKISDQVRFEFGTSYGMCAGPECVTTYRIAGDKLYKITSGPGINASLKTTELSAAALAIAKELQNTPLPDYLFQNKNKSFGCPDCYDQGGTSLRITDNEGSVFWAFDNTLNSNPADIKDYILKIWNTIGALK